MQYEGKRSLESLQFAATSGRVAAGKKPSKGYKAPYSRISGKSTKSSKSKSSGGSKPAKSTVANTKPAKMSKAPVNKAKQAYRAATSRAREARMLAGGATTTRGLGKRTDAGAQNIRRNVKAAQAAAAKVRKMEATRGKYKPRTRR